MPASSSRSRLRAPPGAHGLPQQVSNLRSVDAVVIGYVLRALDVVDGAGLKIVGTLRVEHADRLGLLRPLNAPAAHRSELGKRRRRAVIELVDEPDRRRVGDADGG